jgi:hypothetical protein
VAAQFLGQAKSAHPALLDGELGVLVTPGGRLLLVLRIGFRDGRISTIEVVADPAALGGMEKELVD